MAWVKELFPESASYAAGYDEYGMLGGQSVMAHCIYMEDEEMELLKERGTMIAHCPNSNANVRSGIAPIRRYMEHGLKIGLGTDISGGSTLDMSDAVRDSLTVSRLRWRICDDHPAFLTAAEAFALATAGGGEFFGRVGRFEPGYEFDAVAVDDSAWLMGEESLERRFEKMIYQAHSVHVKAKYVAGRMLF